MTSTEKKDPIVVHSVEHFWDEVRRIVRSELESRGIPLDSDDITVRITKVPSERDVSERCVEYDFNVIDQ